MKMIELKYKVIRLIFVTNKDSYILKMETIELRYKAQQQQHLICGRRLIYVSIARHTLAIYLPFIFSRW